MNQAKQNYQKILDATLAYLTEQKSVPTLLLHACCAPCSSYVLEYLSNYFYITVFYYNPNISPREEYEKRVEELRRFVSELPAKNKITFLEGRYEPERFYEIARGFETVPEGGE